MKPFFANRIVAYTLLIFAAGMSMPSAGPAQVRTGQFTVEDIYSGSKFSGKSIRGLQWIENGKAYSYLETDTAKKRTDIWRYDVGSGKRSKLIDASALVLKEGDSSFSIQNYTWSPDGRKVLFTGTLTARALKTGGNFFLYDLGKKEFSQLTTSDEEQLNVKFSPDSKMIGFVRSNSVVVLDLNSRKESRLTAPVNLDAEHARHVLRGHFDWVYEEEFGIIDGWQWSPDGKRIAFWEIDENREPEFPIMNFLPLHEEVTRMRYPKAGDPNGVVRIGIVPVEAASMEASAAPGGSPANDRTVWADIGAPADSAQDTYVPRIRWTNDPNVLAVERLNRLQNRLDLTLVDAATGAAKVILTETSKTWVEVRDDLTFLKHSKQFVWSSEQDGHLHLYLYDMSGGLVRQLTQGDWDVEKLNGVDEASGTVYFTAGMSSPINRELYAVRLDGTHFRRITKETGSVSANFSPDCSVFIENFSDANTPGRTSLRKNDGSLVRVIEDGAITALKDYALSQETFFTFKTTDGVELNGWMIKPFDFDPSRKYPVLMSVYGGPGSQTVRNSWGGANFLWYQLLAQKGYIIVSVDNRGTGARGTEFKTVTYRHLGKWESNDQIEAAKYLASLPYVDGSRIGIWGWSYGGYMTLMSLLNGGDVFRAGVSVAPVTSWKFYDSIYTERYMQTPAENPEGYEESAPITHAGRLKSKLLEIHGTADDNVHWQNTVTMVNELIKAGKQFETAFYPGGYHGIGGGKIRVQLFTKITNFLLENL